MNAAKIRTAYIYINKTRQALMDDRRSEARFCAMKAISLAPELEEPWIFLGILGSPHASLYYLQHALRINPKSQSARHALHWAIKRQRQSVLRPIRSNFNNKRGFLHKIPSINQIKSRENNFQIYQLAGISLITFLICINAIIIWTLFSNNNIVIASAPATLRSINIFWKPTTTSTPTIFSTSALQPTLTATPSIFSKPTLTQNQTTIFVETTTYTPTITETPSPTSTFSATSTFPNTPTSTDIFTTTIPTIVSQQSTIIEIPPGIDDGEHWLDVDLSEQRLYAYAGKEMIRSFLVSTGTWYTQTLTGTFSIYAKFPSADMVGPDYNLPDVPYVMFYDEDFGIHGTYWHNNFGTPVSHGCVNMEISDAEWVYEWSYIGTIVNIHQ